jgi:hypothetical protein
MDYRPMEMLRLLLGEPLERVSEALLACTPVMVGGRVLFHLPNPPPRTEARSIDGLVEVYTDRPGAVVGREGWRIANAARVLRALGLAERPRLVVLPGEGREPRPIVSAIAVAMLAERGGLPELPAPGWVDRKRLYALPLDLRRLLAGGGEPMQRARHGATHLSSYFR